ncbi:AMP-binding protein [Roseibium sp.]|uniref:AMP-binding protein n=1 Tax=Roseibium sp. TaxID=1936156 RepID=UPI003A979404
MTGPLRDVRTIEDIEAIEAAPYDDNVTAHNLHDLLRATAAHCGKQKALTVLRSGNPEDVGISLTHDELLHEVNRAANMFRKLGLKGTEGSAAFLTPTVPELQALLLGAQIAGVASSLNYLLNRETIADLMSAHEASILVIPARHLDEGCWDKALGLKELVPSLRHVIVIGGGGDLPDGFQSLNEAMAGCGGETLDFEIKAGRDTVCALFHTGGTTGKPKLVQLTHGNQIHAAFGFGQVYAYCEKDIAIAGFPLFHVGGTMTVGLSVIAAGGHLIIPSPYGLRSRDVIDNYWKIVRHFQPTVISGVPTSIAALTRSLPEKADFSHIRLAMTGGAVLPKAVGEAFEAKSGIRLYETYGMTETAAAIAFNPGRGEPVMGSVGFRAPYSETRIVLESAEGFQECEREETGLVQVRGRQVFPGYFDPAQNEGVLDAEGWLTTGDVGYLTKDQRLVLTGRQKDLIVRSGHNIDPAAIEDVANQFEGIAISAAVGMPDQYAGEVPVLFVVPEPGADVDTGKLEAFLRAGVHEPPARPRCLLMIKSLPVTAVGKIFKPALRDMAIEEKVRQEVEAHCGVEASAQVEISLDDQKRVFVDVLVAGTHPDALKSLEESLSPLPQIYQVRSV